MPDLIDAVIVTYNRLGMLKECVEACVNQTHPVRHVYVVDNLSTDGTREWLQSGELSDKVVPVLLDANMGGAGGFYHGIKRSYEDGADWVWIMDDDTEPTPDAVKNLVESRMFNPEPMFELSGFLASCVNWTNGERCRMNIPMPAWEWNWFHDKIPGCYRVNAASFVSILINRKAIAAVGYPVKEFFIWYDDWEYTQRITAKFPAFYVMQSEVTHKTPANVAVDYTTIDEKNVWKYRYGIRNEVSILNKGLGGWPKCGYLILSRCWTMWRGGVKKKLVFKIFLSGLRGLFFNYRKKIEMPAGDGVVGAVLKEGTKPAIPAPEFDKGRQVG